VEGHGRDELLEDLDPRGNEGAPQLEAGFVLLGEGEVATIRSPTVLIAQVLVSTGGRASGLHVDFERIGAHDSDMTCCPEGEDGFRHGPETVWSEGGKCLGCAVFRTYGT
jgi:hypothetical protein